MILKFSQYLNKQGVFLKHEWVKPAGVSAAYPYGIHQHVCVRPLLLKRGYHIIYVLVFINKWEIWVKHSSPATGDSLKYQ